MNGDADNPELQRLTDHDVSILYDICKRASLLHSPPYKALFEAYSEVLAENGIKPQHDDHLFRVLMPIGQEARATEPRIDPLTALKRLLIANNITVVEDDEDGQASEVSRAMVEEEQQQTNHAPMVNRVRKRKPARRMSFNDTRLEETWLSERSIQPDSHSGGLMSLPPRRQRNGTPQRRASISSQRDSLVRPPAHKHFQEGSAEDGFTPEYEARANPILLFEPSKVQLENNAEAFAYMAEIRLARRSLGIWCEHTRVLQENHMRATQFDRRLLLKQGLDQWRMELRFRRARQLERIHVEAMEAQAEDQYRRHVIARLFFQWQGMFLYQREQIAQAHVRILQIRYFTRWKNITEENIAKSRIILTRKFTAIWQEKLARRQLSEEQAMAFREETSRRSGCRALYWKFVEVRAEMWRTDRIVRRYLVRCRHALHGEDDRKRQADEFYICHITQRMLGSLRQRLSKTQRDTQDAVAHHQRTLQKTTLISIAIEARLAPLCQTITLQVDTNLQRKAFKVWHLHLTLVRQAAEVDRKRVMQNAWTNWNDALRCRALAQKIDERLLVENLYRWVLQGRLRIFWRTRNLQLARNVLVTWSARVGEVHNPLRYAEQVFVERQQRRRLAFGMIRLHTAMREREDAERTAVEFANSRYLPSLLNTWSEQAQHVQQLDKWAADARFYTLTTNAIKSWQVRTEQQKAARRRDAYVHIRARIKIRMACSALNRMREHCVELQRLHNQADVRAINRLFVIGTAGFDSWRERTQQLADMQQTATVLDHQRLLGSALAAISAQADKSAEMEAKAEEHRLRFDDKLVRTAVKKIQWFIFNAARRAESADALCARTRDRHVRRMIAVWYFQAKMRRGERGLPRDEGRRGREVEQDASPSLRPASRAASRSAMRGDIGHPSLTAEREAHTPAYLRTPSRSHSKKAGRFRPVLPTPAPVTPFRFESSYLTTTPGPQGTETEGAELVGDTNAKRLYDGGGDEYAESDYIAHPIAAEELSTERFEALTPHVTPFERKLRAGGFGSSRSGRLGTVASGSVGFFVGGTAKNTGLDTGGAKFRPTPPASTTPAENPPSALRGSIFGRSLGATSRTAAKIVRFSGARDENASRFQGRGGTHFKGN